MGLHEVLVLVHGFYPSPLSSELKEYSERVKAQVQNTELVDFNLLRLLVKTFQSVRGCAQFSPLCEKCGLKVTEQSQIRSCRPSCGGSLQSSEFQNQDCSICSSVAESMLQCGRCKLQFCEACVTGMGDMFEAGCTHQAAKVCGCGELAHAHPWSKRAISECCCGTSKSCILFVLKTFLAHDGLAETLRLIASAPTHVQRYSYTLLWLLCEPSEAQLLHCRGGSRFTVNIEPEKNKKDEFMLSISTATVPYKTRRKLVQMVQFADSMRALLRGSVDLPEMPKNKSKAETADLVKIHLSVIFDLIAVPESYRKVVDNPKARALLREFLDVNESLLKVRKDLWVRCVTDCIQAQRARGTLPRWMVHLLAEIFGGNIAEPPLDIWNKLQEEPESKFAMDDIVEDGLLPLILLAVPAAPDALMIALLENLNTALARPRSWSFMSEKFQLWFLPILLDHYGSAVSSTCLLLCIELLSSLHVHYILQYSKHEAKNDSTAQSPDGLLSSTIAMIGSENGTRVLPWPKRHTESVVAFGLGVARKLVAASSFFLQSIEHPAWANIFPVLDVFRNMTWCPVSSGASELVVQHLLSKPLRGAHNLLKTHAVALLSERMIAVLRTLLQSLKLFDSFEMDTSLPIGSRSRAIKGPGLAYLAYFRDCFRCFKSAASEDQVGMLGLLFGSYHFDLSYSKEEEARLKLINFVDTNQHETVEQPVNVSAQEWQFNRDLETMRAGILVWNVAGGKIQQSYLHIERQAVLGMLSARGNVLIENNLSHEVMAALVSASSSTNLYALVLDSREKKTMVPLFDQHTLEFSSDSKVLNKHCLEFAEYLGFTFVSKKRRTQFLCSSVSDLECLQRVLPELRKGNPTKSAPPPPKQNEQVSEIKEEGSQQQVSIVLHALIAQIHRFCATESSRVMWEFSEKVHETLSSELADLNRLKFLTNMWQSKTICELFLVPCEKCGKSAKDHALLNHRSTCSGLMQVSSSTNCSSCRIPSQNKIKPVECQDCGKIFCGDCQECQQHLPGKGACAGCGKLPDVHPWQKLAVGTCRCGTDGECHLLTAKTFLAHGGLACLERLSCQPSSQQGRTQRYCLHLLGLLCNIPQSSFARCRGGTFARVSIAVVERDLQLVVEANSTQTKLSKKLSALSDFEDRMAELLTGVNLPKARGRVDVADVASSSTALFEVLQVPENFRKMCQVAEARELFHNFLEIDGSKNQVSRDVLSGFVARIAQAHLPQRNLSFDFMHALTQLMNEAQLHSWSEIISDLAALPVEDENQEFVILKISDFWIVSLILLALPATPEGVATGVVRELTHFFLSHSQYGGFKDESFQRWFLPLVFEYSAFAKETEPISPRQFLRVDDELVKFGPELSQLLVNLLCIFQLQIMLNFARLGQADRGVELLANTLMQIGTYKTPVEAPGMWVKRNVEAIHIFAAVFLGKISALVASFRNDIDHENWDVLYGVLNIYRNMTWCPSDRMQQHLMSKPESQFLPSTLLLGSDSGKSTAPSIALLTEPIVGNLVLVLAELKLSNVEVKPAASSDEVARSKLVKGAGLAFTSYFSHCSSVFQAVKNASLADQGNVISQFFGAYKFDTSYSKEDDTAYTLEQAPQSSRRRSLGKGKGPANEETEAKRRHLRDLGTLSVGLNVWQVDLKGSKIKQRIAALKSEGVEFGEEKKGGGLLLPIRRSASSSSERYSLVIESKGTKSSLKLFEQATLEPTCDAKILAKHNLEYASHLGMTLLKAQKPVSYLICTSLEDFQCWERVLRTLNERFTAVEEQRLEAERPTVMFNDLHTLINLVHQSCSTPSTLALLEASRKIQVLGSPPLEELNRVRLLLHAWQDKSAFVCSCNADERSASVDGIGPMNCQMLGVKSFLSYGLVGHLIRVTQPTSSHLELASTKYSVWLLGALTNLFDESFLRCWGGAPVRVKVDLQSKEILLLVDANTVRFELRKKISAAKAFLSAITDVLQSGVKLPKGTTNFQGDSGIKSALQEMFDFLSSPDNFLRLTRLTKARVLFLSFLDMDSRIAVFSKEAFFQYLSSLVATHTKQRTLPSAVLHALVRLMVSADLKPFPPVLADPDSVPLDGVEFSISTIKEFGFLPFILQILSAVPKDFAIGLLHELRDCFNRQPQLRSRLIVENLAMSFVPVLFENFDLGQSPDRGDVFYLTLEILAASFAHHLLHSRSDGPVRTIASFMASLGTFALAEGSNSLWPIRNVRITNVFTVELLSKLVQLVSIFRTRRGQFADSAFSMFEFLNVCRNMTWCPLSSSTEPIVRHLLSPQGKHQTAQGFTLLTLHIVEKALALLDQLNLFELDFLQDPQQIRALKGPGLAFIAYFRACTVVFGPGSDDQTSIAQLFQNYKFDTLYSKDVERMVMADTSIALNTGKKDPVIQHIASLQGLISLMHDFCPTSLNVTLWEQSQDAQDTGDLGRLQALRRAFQGQYGCVQFSVPCKTCSKPATVHPWQRTTCPSSCSGLLAEAFLGDSAPCASCTALIPVQTNAFACAVCVRKVCTQCVREHGCQQFFPASSSSCVCGRLQAEHPWTQHAGICQCGSDTACILFSMKTFMAHGGVRSLERILMDQTPFTQQVECLRLLILLSSLPEEDLVRCRGGATVAASVERITVRVGLVDRTELLVTVNTHLLQTKIQKTLVAGSALDVKIRKLLDGVVSFPAASPTSEATLGANLNSLFECLSLPENFHRMSRVQEARNLFEEFLELDYRSMRVTKEYVKQCAERLARSHAQARSLPASLFHILFEMMTDNPLQQAFFSAPLKEEIRFSIHVYGVWMLPLIFLSIPGTTSPIALAVLRAMAEVFENHSKVVFEFLAQEKFQACFLPLFFDAEPRAEVLALTVDIFAQLHVNYFLAARSGVSNSGGADLFASTITMIGAYDAEGDIAPWSKRNVEVIQDVTAAIASALTAKITSMPARMNQQLWLSGLEMLNVCRNMVWCPAEQKEKGFIDHLLSRPDLHRHNLAQEHGISLMSATLSKTLKLAMQSLKLFDIEDPTDSSELAKVNYIKGWALALMAFFWDLVGCFRSETQPVTQLCILAHFYGTFVFDTSFSKIEEARLRLLEDTEQRVMEDPEDKKMWDVDVLAAGISAWQVPNKRGGKVQQCYLSVVLQTASPRAGKNLRRISAMFASTKINLTALEEYSLVLEYRRRKTTFKLFDLEVRMRDCQLLSLNSLDFAASTSIAVVHQRKRIELVCLHLEEFEALARFLDSQAPNFRLTGKGEAEVGFGDVFEENELLTPQIRRDRSDSSGKFLFPLRKGYSSSSIAPPPPPPLPNIEINLKTTTEGN